MSSYFEKLNEYYKSDKADKDNQRFIKQAKNTFISSAIILGIVFLLIIIIVVIMGIQSVFN
jgi:t-SNARE complex subunit (syntaxin)